MNGLGGLNKSPDGVVIAVVQLQLPVVATLADLAAQTDSDSTFNSMGEGMACSFDGGIIAHGTSCRVDEIITAEVRPDLMRKARALWCVESNIYQLGHRGYVPVRGGAGNYPYPYATDLAGDRCRLPWEDRVLITDGTTSGIPAPTRFYMPFKDAAE